MSDRSRIQDILSDQLTELQAISNLNVSPIIEEEYNGTYYVSSAGDNSDGLTWGTAFTSLATALNLIEANQVVGEHHLVRLNIGTFDINTTGLPTYTANIDIKGAGEDRSFITNTHATATGVIVFVGVAGLYDLTIATGNSGINGIIVTGVAANGFTANNVHIVSYGATGAMLCFGFENVHAIHLNNVHIDGDTINSTGLHLNHVTEGEFYKIVLHECAIGLHLDHTNDDDNCFEDFQFGACAMGIQIDNPGAAGNVFKNICMHECVVNVSDASLTTIWSEVILSPKSSATVYPADLTGVTVTAGVGANTWGALPTEIRSAVAATKPFYITGVIFDPDTLEKYGLRLSDDGGTTWFWEGLLEGLAAVANRSQRILFIDKFNIRQGTAVVAEIKSETGGNTMDLWLKIEEI